MRIERCLKLLSLLLLLIATTVVVLGAFTRLADAGLGCPDWPTCYGHLWVPDSDHEIAKANTLFSDTPVETDKTWPEQIHRIFASNLGLLILIAFCIVNFSRAKQYGKKQLNSVSMLLALLVVGTVSRIAFGSIVEVPLALVVTAYFGNLILLARNQQKPERNAPFILISILSGLVILQGLFGMWTVTWKLWPQVVTAHLLGGFATLSLISLFVKYCWCGAQLDFNVTRKIKILAYVVLALVIIQIALGGWMSSNYAALACPDFPMCQNSLLPAMDFTSGFNFFQHVGPNYLYGKLDNHARTAIHYSHRMGALIVSIGVLLLSFALISLKNRLASRFAFTLLAILLAQVTLGISNIVFGLPIEVAVLHNAGGAALLICVIIILHSMKTNGVR